MAIAMFKSFWPTARRWFPATLNPNLKLITDGDTGAPIGIQSQNANGPDGIWAPTPLTAAQVASPPAVVLADLNATFQLNESPYSRYRSNGVELLGLDDTAGDVIPPGQNWIMFSPLVVYEGRPLVIQGGLRVIE